MSAAACAACSDGEFQELEGQKFCKVHAQCAPGQFVSFGGNKTSDIQCQPCSRGTYQNEAGASNCKNCTQCSNGLMRDKCDGAFEGVCSVCLPGNFIDKQTCTPCAPGTYQDSMDASSCIPCEVGRYQDGQGSTSCKMCQPGQHQNSTRQIECVKCSVGRYASDTGKTNCDICDREGTACTTVGLAKPEPCALNSFCEVSARSESVEPKHCPNDKACSSEEECEESEIRKCTKETLENCRTTRCRPCLGDTFPLVDLLDPTKDVCQHCPTTLCKGDAKCISCVSGNVRIPDENIYCPQCVAANGGSMPLHELMQIGNGSDFFIPCEAEGHCNTSVSRRRINTERRRLGAEQYLAVVVSTSCGKGRTGALCSLCADGYGAAGPNCVPCPANGTIEAVLIIMLIVFLVLFFKSARNALKFAQRNHKSVEVTMTSLKILFTFLFSELRLRATSAARACVVHDRFGH